MANKWRSVLAGVFTGMVALTSICACGDKTRDAEEKVQKGISTAERYIAEHADRYVTVSVDDYVGYNPSSPTSVDNDVVRRAYHKAVDAVAQAGDKDVLLTADGEHCTSGTLSACIWVAEIRKRAGKKPEFVLCITSAGKKTYAKVRIESEPTDDAIQVKRDGFPGPSFVWYIVAAGKKLTGE